MLRHNYSLRGCNDHHSFFWRLNFGEKWRHINLLWITFFYPQLIKEDLQNFQGEFTQYCVLRCLWQFEYLDLFLLHCINLEQLFQVTEIYNFSQDDLMTEDIFILDCYSDIFVWVGQEVDSKSRMQALTIGEVKLVLPVA